MGKAIHPSSVEGQIQGGSGQGIGWALHEEYLFSERGHMLNASYLDYPRARLLSPGRPSTRFLMRPQRLTRHLLPREGTPQRHRIFLVSPNILPRSRPLYR